MIPFLMPMFNWFLLLVVVDFIVAAVDNDQVLCPYPYSNISKSVQVEFKFRFFKFDYFHDVDGYLGCSGYLIAKWYNPCGWEQVKKMYPNRTREKEVGFLLDAKYFWIPLVIQQHDPNPEAFGTTDLPLTVGSDGFVEFWGRKQWRLNCKGQFSKFPLDEHHCSFIINIWDTPEFVKMANATLDLDHGNFKPGGPSLFSAEFQPVKMYSTKFPCNNEWCYTEWAEFPIVLKRHWFPYYLHGVVVPFLLLILLQLSTFILPHDQTDRISLSATVFLSSAVFSSQIMSYFPETSEHIFIVTSGTLAMFLNALATSYFIGIYAYKDNFSEKTLLILQKVVSIAFLFFYMALIGVTFFVIFN